jgi:FkbM family methyltransferase
VTWRPTPGEAERLLVLGRTTQTFERIVAGLARELLLPGEGAVDGGAHRGLHTGLLRRLAGPRGWVLAVEPQPFFARVLRTLQVPSEGHAPCTVVEAALAARAGRAPFHQVRNNLAYSGLRLRDTPTAPQVERLEVECVTLDGLLLDRPRLGLIKLDLEGGEFPALQGARETLARQRPAVIFECGRAKAASLYGYSREDYFGFFAANGYRLLDLFGAPFGPADWERKPVPFYRAAVPRGSGAEARVLQALPRLARACLVRPVAC